MNITKSLFVAVLLTSVAAVSFAQARESSTGKSTPLASVAKTVSHKKHHHHHHHAGQQAAGGKMAPASH